MLDGLLRIAILHLVSNSIEQKNAVGATQPTLDTFTRAYIECALWSSNDESNEQGGEPMDANYDADDIAPDALTRIVSDCERFQRENAALLEVSCLEAGQQGHDFWLSRNGHGAGFFDRYTGTTIESAACDQLQEICREFGTCDLYVGDDKQLHLA